MTYPRREGGLHHQPCQVEASNVCQLRVHNTRQRNWLVDGHDIDDMGPCLFHILYHYCQETSNTQISKFLR